MVLDHLARVAFTARSNRADPVALERFATHFNYEPMVFDTADAQGKPIYHTNVLMCIATQFALVALDAMVDPRRAAEVRQRLEETGREVLPISQQQVADFAGNAIELSSPQGRVLALSARAAASLTADQRHVIERSAQLLPLDVPTIELAGGSVRCMLAGIHLAPTAFRPEAPRPDQDRSVVVAQLRAPAFGLGALDRLVVYARMALGQLGRQPAGQLAIGLPGLVHLLEQVLQVARRSCPQSRRPSGRMPNTQASRMMRPVRVMPWFSSWSTPA